MKIKTWSNNEPLVKFVCVFLTLTVISFLNDVKATLFIHSKALTVISFLNDVKATLFIHIKAGLKYTPGSVAE